MSLLKWSFNRSVSWNPEKGPEFQMHREVGFLRIKPGTNQVALVIAHNFGKHCIFAQFVFAYFVRILGVSETLDGTFQENQLTVSTSGISRMCFASEPAVTYVRQTPIRHLITSTQIK